MRAFKSLGDLREPSRFPAWLGRIVRNFATKIGKREQRELRTRERWSLDPAIQPEESASNEEANEAELRSAIEDLPDEYREALMLFHVRGESMAKAAELADLSEGSFRTRLHRARKKLRIVLEQRTEEGRKRLGPSRSLVPLVMALLPMATSNASAAGLATVIGGKTLGSVFKTGAWFLAFPFIQLALMLGSMTATPSATIRSFRDPDDPCIQLFRRSRPFRLLLMLFILGTVFLSWQALWRNTVDCA